MSKVMLISIKPEFVEKIFNGSKSIELRKSTPKVSSGDIIVIYCTFPVKSIVGYCVVDQVIKMSPNLLWEKYNKLLGIDKKRFLIYYENVTTAIGIKLTKRSLLEQKISLEAVRNIIPNFHPPQTFRYYDKDDFSKFIYFNMN